MTTKEAINHYTSAEGDARADLIEWLLAMKLSIEAIDNALVYVRAIQAASHKRGIAIAADRMHGLFAFECEKGN